MTPEKTLRIDPTPSVERLGLYVHLPFCRARCTYCPFAISTNGGLEDAYVDALAAEIERAPLSGTTVDSLFFGGGTPSRLSVTNLGRLLAAIRDRYRIASGCEITLESNPEDVTAETLDAWIDFGINRVSLGVQSLFDEELRPLGRMHGRLGALRALELISSAPIRSCADVILGLPRQTLGTLRESLRGVIHSGVGHLSLYMLDLEPGTKLEQQVQEGKVPVPTDEEVVAMYELAAEETATAGLTQYEVSNFARPGERSRHNLKYWEREPYLGFGLSAHSFLGRERFANTRDIDDYIRRSSGGGDTVDFRETLTDTDVRHERIFLGLRQVPGLERDAVIEMCGKEGAAWVEKGRIEGWLRHERDRVSFTPSGFVLSNEYISQLF